MSGFSRKLVGTDGAVPLRPVIDVEAREIPPANERERAIEGYVDCIMAVNAAFDRRQVRQNIKIDLLSLANSHSPHYYKWRLVSGRHVVEHPDVANERRTREYQARLPSEIQRLDLIFNPVAIRRRWFW